MNQSIQVDKLISKGNVRANIVPKSDADYKALKNSIKRIGIDTPVTYRTDENGDLILLNGHQRLQIAKDLKMETIPAFEVNGSVDDITRQIETNLRTIPMTHLDASFAIDKMVEQGVVTTRKALKAKFGKNTAWVDVALALCNLHPLIREFLKNEKISDELSSHLMEISKSTITQQDNEIKDFLEDGLHTDEPTQDEFNDAVEDYGYGDCVMEFFDDLRQALIRDESKWEYICKVIGEDTFREYETNHDVKYEYQNVLFQEYAKGQWCQNTDFLREVFLNETEIGHWLLQKEMHHLEEYTGHSTYFDFGTTLATLKKNIKKDSGVALKDIVLEHWRGDVFSPRLCYSIDQSITEDSVEGSEDDTSNDVSNPDNDPNWLKYNKFNKWAYPFVDAYVNKVIDPLQKNEEDVNKVFEWIMKVLEIRVDFSIGWEEGRHPLKSWLKGKTPMSNDEIVQAMTPYWFEKHYDSANFQDLDDLLEFQDMVPCREMLAETFHTDKEAREGYFKVFTKNELVDILGAEKKFSKISKTELVELAADNTYDEIPYFDLVCTNLGSGPTSLSSYKS